MRLVTYFQRRLRKFIGIDEIDSKLNEINLFSEKFSNLSEMASLVATISSAKYIQENMLMAKPLYSKFEVLDFCLSQMNLLDGLICEFGVYQGETINYIAKKVKKDVLGFDSFEGLPENWRYGFEKGIFGFDIDNFNYEKNVKLIKGYFHETLPEFLLRYSESISLLHIDCDLYSSTKTILDFLNDRLMPGTIIVFDEYFNYPGWEKHEFLAFSEFINKSGRDYEYLCYNKFHEQVAVRLIG